MGSPDAISITIEFWSLSPSITVTFTDSRQWDHKTKKWYYHTAPEVEYSIHTGYTGGIIVGLLVVLLWLYSFYRLWMVWAYTLNFDGVSC